MQDEHQATIDRALGMFTRPRRREARPEEAEILKGARRLSIDYGGLELAAWAWGEGKRALLVHGWESRAAHMSAFVPGLIDRGYEVIALDAPAHGDSQGELTDVVDYGRALLDVERQLRPLDAIIAHSVGSAAVLYALANGAKAKASVHLCGPSSLTRVIRRAARMFGLDETGAAQLENLMSVHLGSDLDLMDLTNLRHGMAHPALILHDPEDQEVPVGESHELAVAWPGAALMLVPGVGHRKIIQDPETVSRVTEFVIDAAARSTERIQ